MYLVQCLAFIDTNKCCLFAFLPYWKNKHIIDLTPVIRKLIFLQLYWYLKFRYTDV